LAKGPAVRLETETLRKVQRELRERDIAFEILEGKHLKVQFHHGGRRQLLTLARSTRDFRATQNTIARLRRLLDGGR
jgi:hypothetical protein